MVRFPTGTQPVGAKGRGMSEATKESAPATVAGEQAVQPTSEEPFSLSVEEADRVASQFKPAWEVDQDEPPALEASPEPAEEPPAESAEQTAPVAQAEDPPSESTEETKPARAEVAPTEDDEDVPVEEEQGPVDIVANIPKRTEIQLKDEPSVVVPHDEPAFAPAPPPAVSAIVEPDLVVPVDRRDRNKKIVIGVVAVAALLFVVGGAKALLSGDEPSSSPSATTQPAEKPTAPEALPPVKVEPPATATATTEPEATEAPPEEQPPEEPAAVATKENPPSAPPATTTPKPPKTATPPAPTKTAPTPPKTSEPKPPKTAAPPPKPPPTKQPSGGIVRETPF